MRDMFVQDSWYLNIHLPGFFQGPFPSKFTRLLEHQDDLCLPCGFDYIDIQY